MMDMDAAVFQVQDITLIKNIHTEKERKVYSAHIVQGAVRAGVAGTKVLPAGVSLILSGILSQTFAVSSAKVIRVQLKSGTFSSPPPRLTCQKQTATPFPDSLRGN